MGQAVDAWRRVHIILSLNLPGMSPPPPPPLLSASKNKQAAPYTSPPQLLFNVVIERAVLMIAIN
jgi:hypothetical protein